MYQGAREPILPPREEWEQLAIKPGSITWERTGDARVFAASGTALLLQVAHPTVGAGVSDFSTFRDDPWGRLWRTLDFSTVLVYGGAEAAAEMGARIRGFHKVIKGRKPDGTPYHALEPEAYAWVHATLAEGIMAAHARFGRPFTAAEARQFWAEWRPLGRFLGIRWRDLPEDYADYRAWIDEIVNERLERTAAVEEVHEALTSTPPPPSPKVGERTWGLATKPMLRFAGLATSGLMPKPLRERLELELTRPQQLELRALGAMARGMTPLMPGFLLNTGPGYLKWRREPIARGDVASPEANPHLAERFG
ncbi:MAG TPA: oxygenase MpaB family protein [Solirubrobacterales bacterium]|nr:oxygenase MpaB family protein [Solirubrobacterales bacterium]